MTRNERQRATELLHTVAGAVCLLLFLVCACIAGQCSDRGTGRLTRVFGLHSETSVLYLRFDCADGSWREEARWGALILDDYARATNNIGE